MILADFATGVSASSIEISKAHMSQPVGVEICLKNLFKEQLGCAVGVDRVFGRRLHDGELLWHSIDCAARGKDEKTNFAGKYCVHQLESRLHIVLKIFTWILDRLPHIGRSREMHHRIDSA